jgi:hypothetical protein
MEKKTPFNRGYFIVFSVLCFFVFAAFAAQYNYNLKVPTGDCKLVQASNCFNDSTRQKAFDVGSEVTKLSSLYRFCTQIQVFQKGKPARIILALDNSSSMCMEVLNSCPGATKNDTANKRVDGALQFVDQVASRCQTCEIGVVVYTGVGNNTTGRGTVSSALVATPLNSAANISAIKAAINLARCSGTNPLTKIKNDAKLDKKALTFTGMALDTAIKYVDANYDSTSKIFERHVILLTDGDWQRPTTATILADYRTNFPGRPLPIIHSVFISDSASHVDAGFPPQGLTGCTVIRDSSGSHIETVPMDLTNLKMAADSTKGMYFPGSTPQTIAATFDSLFKVISIQAVVGLTGVTFTNITNPNSPVVLTATYEPDTGSGHFKVTVPEFILQYGVNTFITTMTTKDLNNVAYTEIDTFTVNRHTTAGTGTTHVFDLQCAIDTVDMAITCRPRSLFLTEFDTVTAKVDPNDTNIFVPNPVTVRAFVPFPDKTDDRTVALFHFDDKALTNSALNGQPGTGSPVYSSTAAFGNAIGSGSFATAALTTPLSADFTFECWINPGDANQTASIAVGTGFSFGVNKTGYITATIGNTTIVTTNAIDKNVWQHVAIARLNGSANIYINGIPMAIAAVAPGAISGSLTIGNFAGGFLDEVRISGFMKSVEILGKPVLDIPIAQNLSWKINNAASSLPTAVLPPSMWQGIPRDELRFQFSNMYYGPVVINFFDTLATPQLMWSKNGDPVFFGSNQVIVDATLRDTSHDGHLDLIDFTWTDDITISTPPDPGQFIAQLQIKTLDGNKDVTLHAKAIVLDVSKKTIHVILNENTDSLVLETGWVNPVVTLTTMRVTDNGRYFIVNKIIDDADPIPKTACFGTSALADTLRIFFSEPVEGTTIDVNNLIRIDQNGVKTSLGSMAPKDIVKAGNMMAITFTPQTIQAVVQKLQELFPGEPSSPARVIDYCIGPTGISVVATLRDTSHEGHLDLIDIQWTDNIAISTVPQANKLISTLKIISLDGNKEVMLSAAKVVLDSLKKTIHIYLKENVDTTLETGWSSSTIALTTSPITNDLRWLVVNKVIDDADPIPKDVCYGFTASADTLHIFFSEPIDSAAISLINLIKTDQIGTKKSLASLEPGFVGKSSNNMTLVFKPKTIQPGQTIEELFPNEPTSPARAIDYCSGGPLIERVLVGPNPFYPGKTLVPYPTKENKNIPGVLFRMDLFIPSKIATGTFTVFDAVGNAVVKDVSMNPDGDYSVSKIWDGKNSDGAYVAGGTYLVRGTAVNTLTKQTETRTGKVGVKTPKKN